MAGFDPFASGAATAVLEKPPASAGGFEPFASGLATARDPAPPSTSAVERDSSPTHDLGTDFRVYYDGLEGMDQRLTPEHRAVFQRLDAVSDNSKAARAQAINQAYIGSQLKDLPHSTLEGNWEAVKAEYAKHVFGSVDNEIPDVKLYGMISKRMKEASAEGSNQGEIKPWTWADTVGSDEYKVGHGIKNFFESINKPVIALPEAPKDLPNLEGMGLYNPALTAAVYNGFVKPTLEGVESPLGIATLGVGSQLRAASAQYPLAKDALVAMEGVFTGLMGYGTAKAGKQVYDVLKNPNSTFDDKATAVSSMVGNGALTLLGAVGTALEMFPKEKATEVAEEMKGKTPAEAAAILWWEASQTDVHGQQFFLEDAAKKLEAIATPEDLAKAKKSAGTSTIDKAGAVIGEGEDSGPQERIKAAAIKTADGKVEEGPAHANIREKLGGATPEGAIEGFVTDKGRFVSREEASQIAQKAKQLKGDVAKEPPKELQSHEVDMTEPESKTTGISNAKVDAELKRLGLGKAKHGESTTDEAELEKARVTMAENPTAGEELVADLAEKPRAPTTAEVFLLNREAARLRLVRNAAEEEFVAAEEHGDQAAKMDARLKIARAQDAYQKTLEVSTVGGTAQAQAFRARQIMLNEDYSLAEIERRERIASGKPLTPEQTAEIGKLSKQLTDAQARIEAYEKAQREAKANPRATKRPPATRRVSEFLAKQADAARERLRAKTEKQGALAGLDPTDIDDYAIIGADYFAKGVTKFADWSTSMVNELGEHIRPYLPEIFKKSDDASDQARRLQAYKARKATEIEKGRAALAAGDLSKPERAKLEMDPDAIKLRGEAEKIKRKIQLRRTELELKNRTPTEWTKDTLLEINRAGVLSRTAIMLKLTAIIGARAVTTPIRQGIGLGVSKLAPGFARGGRMENVDTVGGYVRSESKALTAMLTKGLPGAWDILRMKDTPEQALLEKEHLPPGWLHYPSHIHAALHYPIQVADYVRRLSLINEQDLRAGVDLTEPVNQLHNMQEAWEYSKRQIFLQNNKLVTAYQTGLKVLQSPDKMGVVSPAAKLLALGLQAENPIVKVPANLAEDVGEHVFGLLDPAARFAFKGVGGFKGLNYAETDIVLRHIKNGLLGSALVALGFFKYKQVGGFYQEGEKRKASDAQPGEIKSGSTRVPAVALEDTAALALMAGATLHRTLDSVYRLNDPKKKGIPAALLAVAVGVAEKNPYIRDASVLGKILDPRQREHAVAADIASKLIPGFVQEMAAEQDKKTPYNPFEKPQSRAITAPDFSGALKQNLEKELPYLRKNLPKHDPYK